MNKAATRVDPQDPLEEVVTMIYHIKGSDLLAYRGAAASDDRDGFANVSS